VVAGLVLDDFAHTQGVVVAAWSRLGRALVAPWSRLGRALWTVTVGSFLPNGFELFEMTSNVRECRSDWFDLSYYVHSPDSVPRLNQGTAQVRRGDSYPFHESYCLRYRVGAPSRNARGAAAGNIGLSVVTTTVGSPHLALL
jgi:hypothetical protein